jgi:peptidoglycan/LPS O-acetylase OafA/YrhL
LYALSQASLVSLKGVSAVAPESAATAPASLARSAPAGDRPPRRGFRADIQALRAIAVLLVVVYHLRPNRLPGGYIGVDVFFVISGYLITSHLMREAVTTGRVRLGAFWAARARRILPASLVAIALTIAASAIIAPATLFDDLRKQALASIFYVQNWVLAFDAVDYSAADNDATPFQHFWSLSVEEQFYLFWPLLVFAAVWIVARRQLRAGSDIGRRRTAETGTRQLAMLFFGIVVLASLIFSIVAVNDGQANAYFVTSTRVWELGAGGLLAIVSVRSLSGVARSALAYAGLGAIVVSAFVLTNESPFPGAAALPVILGTMALILAGTPGSDERTSQAPHRFDPWNVASRARVTQWIGDRSYSLYLWHFPVIILWAMAIDRKVGYLDLIGMMVLSVVLADASYRFIEQPVRRAAFFATSTRRSLVGALISMLLVSALAFAYPLVAAQTSKAWDLNADRAQSLPVLGAAAIAGGAVPAVTTDEVLLTPSPLRADSDRGTALSGKACIAEVTDDVTPECSVGDPDGDVSIALIGDSHARMYSAPLLTIAESHGWLLRTYLHNSCPFNPTPRHLERDGELTCTGPNADVLERVLADPPDIVVTTWFDDATFIEDAVGREPGAAGFAEYWNRLEDAGIDVVVIRDVPKQKRNVPDCVAENYDRPDTCVTPRGTALRGGEVLRDAAELAPRATVVDLSDQFCVDGECKSVIGNVIVYRDRHHITDTYALSLVPRLEAALAPAAASVSSSRR